MAGDLGPAALQLDQGRTGLGPLLVQPALLPAEFAERGALPGGDPVEGGGPVEIRVRVGGEQQGEGGVDAAGAVLGAG